MRFSRGRSPALFSVLSLPPPQLAADVVTSDQRVVPEPLAERHVARVIESLDRSLYAALCIERRSNRPAVEVYIVFDLQPPYLVFEAVKVLVANGTGTSGLAGSVTNLLKASNYNALSPVDATKLVDITLVQYKPDFEPEARAIAQLLLLPASALRPMEDNPPVPSLREADILVVAGPDIRLPGEGAAGATTSTTRRS